ncbi:MAG: site-specific integrase [Nanoarchaeota archaeon]|nr:site-specific integrase [Nanoarchaeota archaeon]
MDIHNYEQKYQEALKGLEKSNISERNKELVKHFVNDLVLENISKPRLIKYFGTLKIVANTLGKDFDKVTKEDLKIFIGTIQQKSEFSPWTKQSYKVIIRRFFKWLKGTKDYPEIVNWINIGMKRSEKKLPSEEDLITEKDIQKVIQTADHPRNKAFISLLWESGARVGEIGNLKLKNVTFDKYGIVITVSGKTGSRKIRLISSTPHLATWMNSHPGRENKEAPLWINIGTTNHNKQMYYRNMVKLLRVLFSKAEIKKRCNPHLFRHSRATYMANHLTEFQMNQYFGWIQGSDMPSTYVHMSGKEVDNAILIMNGIETGIKKEESKLQPIICSRCDTINSNDSKHCNKCGGILDLKHAMEIEEELSQRKGADNVMEILMKDKDVQNLLMEKLQTLGKGFSF